MDCIGQESTNVLAEMGEEPQLSHRILTVIFVDVESARLYHLAWIV